MPISNHIYYTEFTGGVKYPNPIILIHGAGSNRLCWPTNMRRFSGCHIITIDLPGHGNSTDIPGEQSIQAYADVIIDFLRNKGFYKVCLVGYSMGGAVAMTVAQQAEGIVEGLGVVACGANFKVPENFLDLLKVPTSAEKTFRDFLKQNISAKTPRSLAEKIIKSADSVRSSVLYGDWLACARFDFRPYLHELKMPVWVAIGTDDKFVSLTSAHFLYQNLSNAWLQEIPAAGHLVALEQPVQLGLGLEKLINTIKSQKDLLDYNS